MDGVLFEEWLRELDRKFESQGRKIVLVVDNGPAHPDVTGLKAINLQFLPPNTTSCTQPMDCLLYTSPSPRDGLLSRMPSSA